MGNLGPHLCREEPERDPPTACDPQAPGGARGARPLSWLHLPSALHGPHTKNPVGPGGFTLCPWTSRQLLHTWAGLEAGTVALLYPSLGSSHCPKLSGIPLSARTHNPPCPLTTHSAPREPGLPAAVAGGGGAQQGWTHLLLTSILDTTPPCQHQLAFGASWYPSVQGEKILMECGCTQEGWVRAEQAWCPHVGRGPWRRQKAGMMADAKCLRPVMGRKHTFIW